MNENEKNEIIIAESQSIELQDQRSHAVIKKAARWILVAAGVGCIGSGFYGVFTGAFSDITVGTLFTSAVSMLAVAISGKHQE